MPVQCVDRVDAEALSQREERIRQQRLVGGRDVIDERAQVLQRGDQPSGMIRIEGQQG